MSAGSTIRRREYVPPPHQAEVDAVLASIRAEKPAAPAGPASAPNPELTRPAPPRPARSEAEIDHRIAEELELAARHLEQIGAALVSDPAFLHRHGPTLQAVDLVNQNLRHLAAVIAAADKEAAAGRISLQELRRRLTRKPIGAPGA
jgi:hypothetical protein